MMNLEPALHLLSRAALSPEKNGAVTVPAAELLEFLAVTVKTYFPTLQLRFIGNVRLAMRTLLEKRVIGFAMKISF